MKRFSVLLSLTLLFSINIFSQHRCSTAEMRKERLERNPELAALRAGAEHKMAQWISDNDVKGQRGGSEDPYVIVPCVFHVLWHEADQNVSDEQIYSQLAALNEDFRLLNADAPGSKDPFYYVSSDTYIEFCLAQQDPDGVESSGITRTHTNVAYWGEDELDEMKSPATGGVSNWDPSKYLNFWIYQPDPNGGTLGFAYYPDEAQDYPEMDGVAIANNAFGSSGTAVEPNVLGRTGTHEVGHWLFLYHIWGDEQCGDDLVDDTPVHFEENYYCPEFPYNANSTCGTDGNGEMFMNYMDYTDDACMYMFTSGQADRMASAMDNFRSGLYTSPGCEAGSGVGIAQMDKPIFSVYPNPSSEIMNVSFVTSSSYNVSITDCQGKLIVNQNVVARMLSLNVDSYPSGIYYITVLNKETGVTQHQKICIQ